MCRDASKEVKFTETSSSAYPYCLLLDNDGDISNAGLSGAFRGGDFIITDGEVRFSLSTRIMSLFDKEQRSREIDVNSQGNGAINSRDAA